MEYDETWCILEDRLHQAIEGRFSSVLQDWENENRIFYREEKTFNKQVRKEYGHMFNSLEDIEKQLRNISGCEYVSAEQASTTSVMRQQSFKRDMNIEQREFHIETVDLFPEVNILKAVISKPVRLFRLIKRNYQKLKQEKAQSRFQKDNVQYMTTLSSSILERIIDSRDIIRALVDTEIEGFKQYVESVIGAVEKAIDFNTELQCQLKTNTLDGRELQNTFGPIADNFGDLLDKTVNFKYRYMTEFEFSLKQLKPVSKQPDCCQIMTTTFHYNDTSKDMVVTAKKVNGLLKERHLFFLIKHVR